ncbi:MAG: LysR family transcriptional regulator [Peptococcaceae bacterium]|mgnify:FL=1|nr:LysR family transcriptional regulator [Peptococcaceae bacterium]
MDINQLKYFITVAQTLNFSEAARRHKITQPSISHHINELEKRVGVKLFLRDKRRVTLTAAGQELLPHAMEIVQAAQNALLKARQAEENAAGHISISAVTAASEVLSRCLSIFSVKYPDILVDISFTSGREQVIAMNANKYDFHFALEDMVPAGGNFDYIISNEDDLCLVLPKGHPMAGQPLDFSKLRNERFIIASETDSPAMYEQIMNVCRARNYKPKIVNRYDRVEAVVLSVAAGLGISIVPRAISKVFFSEKVEVVPIDGPDTKRVYVVAWHKRITNTAAKRFLEIVKELLT